MPLKRTPPPSPKPTPTLPEDGNENVEKEENTEMECPIPASIQHHESMQELSSLLGSITERKKRKLEVNAESSTEGIKDMFDKFSLDQAARFADLQASINNLKDQNSKLTLSVELMSNKYDEFLSRLIQLESESREDKKKIVTLEERIEYLERKSRSSGIEIRNIPKMAGETKQDLCNILERAGKTIDSQIDRNCVKDIYRMKSKDSSNPIIVEFTTVLYKEKILNTLKNYNKSKKPGEKLNTKTLALNGPIKPVYISECLTAKTQKLFYLARLFQQQHKYAFCWTSHGVVYLRKKEKEPHIKITSEKDIETLRKTE